MPNGKLIKHNTILKAIQCSRKNTGSVITHTKTYFFILWTLGIIFVKSQSTEQTFNRRQHSFFYYVCINIKHITDHYDIIVDFVNIKKCRYICGPWSLSSTQHWNRTYTCLHSWFLELLACLWSGEPAENRPDLNSIQHQEVTEEILPLCYWNFISLIKVNLKCLDQIVL